MASGEIYIVTAISGFATSVNSLMLKSISTLTSLELPFHVDEETTRQN